MNAARLVRYGGLAAAGSGLALAIRWPLLDHRSFDFLGSLSGWYGFLVANDFFRALALDFHDYPPLYLYLLAAAAYLFPSGPDLIVIKVLSIVFDFLLAVVVSRCVRLRYPKSTTLPILAGLAALLAPATVVNSALLGQCDGMLALFLVLCLHCLLRRRPAPAFAAFGLAFALKLQAVVLLPFFWWLRQQESNSRPFALRFARSCLVLLPLVYLSTLLPAWLLGRPLPELVMLTFGQADHFRRLNAGAPNPYAWVSDDLGLYVFWPLFAALLLAGFAVLGIAVRRSRVAPTPDLTVTLAVLATFAAPYLLPSMHERYFYPAALLSIVLAFHRPRFAGLPVLLGFASFSAEVGHLAFGWDRVVPARAGAVVLLVPLVGLLRRLLRDLGYRSPLWAGWRWLRERARARRAEAAPLLVLVGCLAAVFTLGQLGGRFDRPAGDDAASVRTLAQVENLSSEHSFVPHSRRRLAADGMVAYEGVVRGAPASYFLLRAVTLHFGGDDREAQLRAARVTMAGFSALAALLAYLALARLFRRRWVALGATLLAFSSFAGGGWDTVSAEGAPALCSLFLCFHGLVAFVRDGRLGPLLLQTGAALALSFVAFWLIAPFLVFAVVERARRQVSGGEGGRALSRDGGVRRIRPALLAGFAVLCGGALAGLGAANEAALRAGGARLVSAAIDGGAETLPALTAALLPVAFRGDGTGAVLVGGSVAALGLLGAAGSGRRRLLLPLALASLLPALPGLGAFGVAPPVGVPLVAGALGLAALRRRRAVAVGIGISLAVFLRSASPTSGGSGSGFGSGSSGEDRATASEARTEARIEARIEAADFANIRQVLRRRMEPLTVFAPDSLVPGPDAAARIAWRLAGNTRTDSRGRRLRRGAGWGTSRSRGWIVLVEREERGLAEFVIERGRRSGPGLLTPRNREFFLHHRAALDGEVDRMIESAGAPLHRGEFDLYHTGEDLLYVCDPCGAGATEGLFVLHLDPEDPGDLRPGRRQFGFENLSFRFSHHFLERGERSVARVSLPDYPLRRLVTGRHPGRRGADFVWRAEIAPAP